VKGQVAKKEFKKGRARIKLHELWSYVVRYRDGFACQWCLFDDRKNVNRCHHAHHIVARALGKTAGSYELDNGVTLCYHCHIDRIKNEPDEYIAFRDAWLSGVVDPCPLNDFSVDIEKYPRLRAKYQNQIVKFTEAFYVEHWKMLIAELERLGGHYEKSK